MGPAHYVRVSGLALSGASAFATPLGEVPVDTAAVTSALGSVSASLILDGPHKPEHALEVELPFLQVVLQDFSIVPVLVGETIGDEAAQLLRLLWGGAETLVVVSSDLSHYLTSVKARDLDHRTAAMIERLDTSELQPEHACGAAAIRGLAPVAAETGLRARTLDLRNSGDTAGSRHSVVGYGAFVFF